MASITSQSINGFVLFFWNDLLLLFNMFLPGAWGFLSLLGCLSLIFPITLYFCSRGFTISGRNNIYKFLTESSWYNAQSIGVACRTQGEETEEMHFSNTEERIFACRWFNILKIYTGTSFCSLTSFLNISLFILSSWCLL